MATIREAQTNGIQTTHPPGQQSLFRTGEEHRLHLEQPEPEKEEPHRDSTSRGVDKEGSPDGK
jgi:hypothetical protein